MIDTTSLKDTLLDYLDETEFDNSILRGNLLANEVKQLLINDLNAFFIGLIADQSVKFEIARSLPYKLFKRLSVNDIGQLYAKYSEEDIKIAIETKPALHRYPASMAGYIYNFIKRINEEYDGCASNLIRNKTAQELIDILKSFKGISIKKAALGLLIMERDLNYNFADKNMIDIACDIHIRRVFMRTGLVMSDNKKEILSSARRLYPDYPGKLTTPIWTIGRNYCYATNPNCASCPLNVVCKKDISKTINMK